MQQPRDPIRHEMVTWEEVDKLVDTLVPQIRTAGSFDGIVLITRGGIIPGGLLAEALDITYILTAAVRFADEFVSEIPQQQQQPRMMLPSFLQFPDNSLVSGRKLLLVDDVWGSGRTSSSIKGRLEAARATPFTCVFHYNPYRSLFPDEKPDFYGAITDAYIIYPWEVDRGIDGLRESDPQTY
jgi:hypothetical protein